MNLLEWTSSIGVPSVGRLPTNLGRWMDRICAALACFRLRTTSSWAKWRETRAAASQLPAGATDAGAEASKLES